MRHLNMFTVIALGTGAAYVYSLVATFALSIFPAGFHGMGGTVSVYYEVAAVITVLLGQVLKLRTREQTGGGICALLTSRSRRPASCATTQTTKNSRSCKLRSVTG